MKYSEEEAFNLINNIINYVDKDLRKRDDYCSEYSILSLLTISKLLGVWNPNDGYNNQVYSTVRSNWFYYENLGCTHNKGSYSMSFRGILDLLVSFNYLNQDGTIMIDIELDLDVEINKLQILNQDLKEEIVQMKEQIAIIDSFVDKYKTSQSLREEVKHYIQSNK
jgi:hypothetical protein